MAPFDPELYLRLLGESELVGRLRSGRNGRNSELIEVARALIHVGAIERTVAAEVVDGYSLAAGLRDGRGLWRRGVVAAQAQTGSPSAAGSTTQAARRVVICMAKLERPDQDIHLRAVTLSETETRVSLTVRERAGSGAARASRRRRPMSQNLRLNYAITDDRGNSFSTHVTMGGGDGHEWRGRMMTDRPLAIDTAWIEFDGTRIDLVDAASPCAASVEPVPESDPGRSYLWFWLASIERHFLQSADLVIDALVAAGSLSGDDPQIEVMREIGSTNWRHRGHMPVAIPAGLVAAPAEWTSLVRPPSGRPARGSVAFHAAVPPFDGLRLTLGELEADEGGWELQFDVSPGIVVGRFSESLDEQRIAWWAVDDRGQHYLGYTGQVGGSPDETSGTVQFHPPIDRRAKLLTLLPTSHAERARIEVPLTWSTT